MTAMADGRCLIRAFLHGVGTDFPAGVADVLKGNDLATRRWLRQVRMDAAAKVKAKFEADAEFKEIVLALLPDLGYDTFELWLLAQQAHDVHLNHSPLWFGGAELLVHGLSELYGVTTVVTSVNHPGGETSSTVAAAGDHVVNLAQVYDSDGVPYHFDLFVEQQAQSAQVNYDEVKFVLKARQGGYSWLGDHSGLGSLYPTPFVARPTNPSLVDKGKDERQLFIDMYKRYNRLDRSSGAKSYGAFALAWADRTREEAEKKLQAHPSPSPRPNPNPSPNPNPHPHPHPHPSRACPS